MSDAGDKGGASQVAGAILRTYGIGGLLLVLGAATIVLSIYKAPDLSNSFAQLIVVIGGPILGLLVIVLGLFLLRKSGNTRPPGSLLYEIYIAAPMAGFGADETGRKAAVDLVNSTQAALQRRGVKNIYTPVLARPEADQYETPAAAFDVEWQALRSTKRYLLILPPQMPAQTSVLVTAGIAVSSDVPTVIFAKRGAPLPYLLEGAVGSKQVNVRVEHYDDFHDIERMIANDGLRLFGANQKQS